ncbi:hypothetical protein BDW42DRAFT_174901 [Aspergillus taichungensis]|uniref:Uncharacterized protein n=1 Tax=Aspergillus taichungensis TaxID=482145 RepID=A0A2J5HMG8_9EURO|nr:hypothetical protein BDW42DRAFT_174901 [Aspergillus taichungensis]
MGGWFQDEDFPQGRLARVSSPPKAEGVSQLEGQGEDDLPWRSSLGPADGGRRGIGEVGRRTINLRSMVCGIDMDSIQKTCPTVDGRPTEYEINKLLLLMVTTMV